MVDLKKQFGQRVVKYRNRAGLTQDQFAEELGVALQTIGHIERGIHGPRFDLIERICIVLKVKPKDLFDF